MEENKNSFFRKQALEKVTSPEELDCYLKVTRPGVWFVLIAIIVLVIGVLCWSVLGHLETTVNVAVVSSNNSTLCLVSADSSEDILKSGKIKIAGKDYTLSDVGMSKMVISSDFDSTILNSGLVKVGDVVIPLKVDANLQNGVYAGEVVTETVKPISFILN